MDLFIHSNWPIPDTNIVLIIQSSGTLFFPSDILAVLDRAIDAFSSGVRTKAVPRQSLFKVGTVVLSALNFEHNPVLTNGVMLDSLEGLRTFCVTRSSHAKEAARIQLDGQVVGGIYIDRSIMIEEPGRVTGSILLS